jgi:hypothetical protein
MPNHNYAAAVDYLVAHPEEIRDAWMNPYDHQAGCLFRFCAPVESKGDAPPDCGCLTMIRSALSYGAFNARREPVDYITEAIRGDVNLLYIHTTEQLRGDELRAVLDRHAEWQIALETELLL